jgi:hypothetical protein
MDAIRTGQSEPVGFPKEDIFVFDDEVFLTLSTAWQPNQAEASVLWRRLKRYRS